MNSFFKKRHNTDWKRASSSFRLVPRHWNHVDLWKKLMMKKWEDYSAAYGEATDKWRPFLDEEIFDSLPRFKDLAYKDLGKPVEDLRKLAKERRGELR